MRRPLLLALLAAAVATTTAAQAAHLPGTSTRADRASWRALLHWPNSCESYWHMAGVSQSVGSSGVQTYPAPGGTLATVTCYFGAYQGTTMFYLVDRNGHPTGPLSLHIYSDPGSGIPKATHETIVLGDFYFSKSGALTIFDKGVGYGGCGIFSAFRLSGTRFIPVASRAKMDCNGNPPHDPSRWPLLPALHGA